MKTIGSFLLLLHHFSTEKHTLQYFYTGSSGISEFPSFVTVGLVDGEQFVYYSSETRKTIPKQEWIRQNEGEDYWESQTQNLIGHEQSNINNIDVARSRFNQSAGVHTFQWMYGCEVDDQTGHTSGFQQYGYDGEDFLSLELEQLRYVSPVPQGFLTTLKWNRDRAMLELQRNYFSSECVEWLQKYLGYRKSSQQERVSPPQVSVLRSSSSSSSSPPLSCHATGFYPPLVTISWYKDGEEVHEDVSLGDLLPNEDGTFQKSSSLSVSPEEQQKHSFSCVVEHQGKRVEEREIRSNSGTGVSAGIIIGVGAAVLLMLVAGAVAWCVIQKKKGFNPVTGSDHSQQWEKVKPRDSVWSHSDKSVDTIGSRSDSTSSSDSQSSVTSDKPLLKT